MIFSTLSVHLKPGGSAVELGSVLLALGGGRAEVRGDVWVRVRHLTAP